VISCIGLPCLLGLCLRCLEALKSSLDAREARYEGLLEEEEGCPLHSCGCGVSPCCQPCSTEQKVQFVTRLSSICAIAALGGLLVCFMSETDNTYSMQWTKVSDTNDSPQRYKSSQFLGFPDDTTMGPESHYSYTAGSKGAPALLFSVRAYVPSRKNAQNHSSSCYWAAVSRTAASSQPLTYPKIPLTCASMNATYGGQKLDENVVDMNYYKAAVASADSHISMCADAVFLKFHCWTKADRKVRARRVPWWLGSGVVASFGLLTVSLTFAADCTTLCSWYRNARHCSQPRSLTVNRMSVEHVHTVSFHAQLPEYSMSAT